MSSSSPETGGFLPGNTRVIMGAGTAGPSEMTVHEIEGTKIQILDEQTELAFWARVRSKAQAKAKEILNQAMAEAETIRETAHQEGLAQGLANSRLAVESELEAMGESLAGLLQSLEAERQTLWTKHRQEFAALLKLAVEKTLHTKLAESRQEVLGNLMDQAIELLDTRAGFTVLVSPNDEQSASQLLTEAKRVHPNLGAWRIKTDPGMTSGGIRLESEAGMVDNTVDTRFGQITELLDRVEFNEGQP